MSSGTEPNLHTAGSTRGGDPPNGYAPLLLGMTRHANVPLSVYRIVSGLRTPLGARLQSHDGGRERRIDARQSRPCLASRSSTGPCGGPTSYPGCTSSAFTPNPRVVRPQLAPPQAAGYKMSFSERFLFRAAGSVGVQDVLFAGVFVPQVWNQHAYQSASRNRPVGMWLRLYHGVLNAYKRFRRNSELLYTSRTSSKTSKSTCHLRRGLRGPSVSTLHPASLAGRLDYGGNDLYFEVEVHSSALPRSLPAVGSTTGQAQSVNW